MEDFERALNKEKLLDAMATMGNLQVAFSDVKMANDAQAKEATITAMACALAATYVAELAAHLQEGMEFYEAIRATARGDMKLSKLMTEKAKKTLDQLNDPMRHN